MGTGAAIGMLSGPLTAVFMFGCLAIYAIFRPAVHLGSLAGPAAIMGGICSGVFGTALGAVAALVLGWFGVEIRGPVRAGLFGGVLMTALAFPNLLDDRTGGPDFDFYVSFGMVAPILAGIVAGVVVGSIFQKGRPDQNSIA
jgi:hypothetical protein